ncbi:MAG: quinolinate synthase NadA [Desulfobacter sp.]|nr:MAG: quinolinate synthase NadA [Desulfobacter sp.]
MDTDFGNREIKNRITQIKHELGNELVILTHHFQRKDIVDLGDHRGDSFGLARRAARDEKAKYILFCGVHFMAESAAILANENQIVQIPDTGAGCWLAEMGEAGKIETAWQEAAALLGEGAMMPVAYINSNAAVKAMCGRHGGTVCTAANAARAFEWAFAQRGKIFFFPDEYLGRNTALGMDIPESSILVWDPSLPLGGNTKADVQKAKVILWNGHCQVHTRFTPDQIMNIRKTAPDARVVVHPECSHEVTALADASGSTSFIARYVAEAPADATIAIGTEINLITRLAAEYPDKRILPLYDAFCPHMHQINLRNLLHTLENIGKANVVTVENRIKKEASIGLENMLNL